MKNVCFIIILLSFSCLYSQNTFNKIYNNPFGIYLLCKTNNGYVTPGTDGKLSLFYIYDSNGNVTDSIRVPLYYGSKGMSWSRGIYHFPYTDQVVSLQIERTENIHDKSDRLSLLVFDVKTKKFLSHTIDSTFTGLDTSFYVGSTLPSVKLNDSTIVCLVEYVTKKWINNKPVDLKQFLLVINESGLVKSVRQVQLDSLNDYLLSFELMKGESNSVLLFSTSYSSNTTPDYRFIVRQYTIDTSSIIIPKKLVNRLDTISFSDYRYFKNVAKGIDNSYYFIDDYRFNYFNDPVSSKYVVKLDSSYNEIWRRIIPGWLRNSRNYVIATKDGGCMAMTHRIQSPNLPRDTPGGDFVDISLTKLNSKGEIEFKATYGDSLDDRGYDIIEDDDGGFVIVGLFNTIIDILRYNWVAGASNNGWMFKVNKYGLPAKTSGVSYNNNSLNEIHIYPNPVNTQLSIKCPDEAYASSVVIIDNVGNIVIKEKSNYVSIDNIKLIDISSLSCGLYYCRINSNNYSITKPFIIIR